MAGTTFPSACASRACAGAARVDPALTATDVGEAVGAQARPHGPGALSAKARSATCMSTARCRPATRPAPRRPRSPPIAPIRRSRRSSPASRSPRRRRRPAPPDKWSLIERARASFDPERSGDFVVLLKPRHHADRRHQRSYVATHGSPWDYDRRVPILFWRRGMAPADARRGDRDGRHHADAGRHDRPCGRCPARSTANA